MLIDLNQARASTAVASDVCIIGAGPAGIAVASRFLGTAVSVALLESGFLDADIETQLLNLGWADGPIVRDHPFYLSSSRLRMFGGSQNGWGGWCTPLLDLDLKRRHWVDDSGWPLTLEQLTPLYRRAASICRLHQLVADPVPETSGAADQLAERWYSFPLGRRTLRQTFETQLEAADNIAVYLGANVTALQCDARQRHVDTVHGRSLSGAEVAVNARFVVLAAGGIENARILLANDLGNQNDLVGRYFMEHPHVVLGSIHLPDQSKYESFRIHLDPRFGHGSMAAFGLPAPTQEAHRLLNAAVQLWPELESGDAPEDGGFDAQLVLRAEQCPNRESRISLSDEVDPFDVPVARLDWNLLSRDWESVCSTAEHVSTALVRHAGADVDLMVSPASAWPNLPSIDPNYHPWGCHHIGTTRMGAKPDAGVVAPDTRVFTVDNLYVAGSSVFPTAGYANPTFTLIALALLTADTIAEGLRSN